MVEYLEIRWFVFVPPILSKIGPYQTMVFIDGTIFYYLLN